VLLVLRVPRVLKVPKGLKEMQGLEDRLVHKALLVRRVPKELQVLVEK
jgi:hypothetical protein